MCQAQFQARHTLNAFNCYLPIQVDCPLLTRVGLVIKKVSRNIQCSSRWEPELKTQESMA